MKITFSTCYYILKAKYEVNIFLHWCENFLSIMTKCNIVFYTNKETLQILNLNSLIKRYLQNENIRVVIYNLEDFHTYNYKSKWKSNHSNNYLLNSISSWKLNMLWNEKIHMVKKTMDEKYFDTYENLYPQSKLNKINLKNQQPIEKMINEAGIYELYRKSRKPLA